MSIYVQFKGQTANGFEPEVEAIGVPPDETERWQKAAADPLWLADQNDFLALSEGTNRELIGQE